MRGADPDPRSSPDKVGSGAADGHLTRHLGRDPVWWAAFILFFGLAATWAFASPLLSVPDEPAHVVKAAAVARGELLGRRITVPDRPGSFVRGGFTTLVHVPLSYTFNTSALPSCYIFNPRTPAGCAPPFVDHARLSSWTTWEGRYPPVFYAAVGWTTLLDTGTRSIYGMRLLNAALCAALLASAFVCAREAPRFRLVALGVVVAATPMTMFLAGSVNPNGLEIAAAICLWVSLGVLVLREDAGLPGHLLATVGISAAVLAWTRPLSTAWLAVIVVVVLIFAGDRRRVRELLGVAAVRVVTAAVAVLAVGAVAWIVFAHALGNIAGEDPRGLGFVDAFGHSLGRAGDYLREMVGVFGWRTAPGPQGVYWAWGLATLTLLGLAIRFGRQRLRLVVVGLVGLSVLAPAVIEAANARKNGFPWQGRYSLPLAVGVPILASLAVGLSGRLSARATAWLSGGVVTVVGASHVIAHYGAMRRYVVGTDGPLYYLDRHGWDPALPPWVLLLAVVGAAAGLAVLTYRVATSEHPLGLRPPAGP